MTTNGPMYDMRMNPCYQIDATAASSGKRIAATKRRVRFRFGFSSAEAIASGASGPKCRGPEHEVTLIWSLTSGKRLVLADGAEVHFSKGNLTEGRFETSWTMKGNHVLKLVAHAALPLFPQPGFRQFDLFLDGMSFFQMPHIYELGSSKKNSSMVPHEPRDSAPIAYNNYNLPIGEENEWSRSMYDHANRPHMHSDAEIAVNRQPPSVVRAEPILMDLITSHDASSTTNMQDLMSDSSPSLELLSYSSSFCSSTAYDEFAPVASVPPTLTNIHSEILGAYGQESKPALSVLPNDSHNYQGPLVTPTNAIAVHQTVSPVSVLSTPSFSSGGVDPEYREAAPAPIAATNEKEPQYESSDVERAMRTLVNLNDITEAAEAPEQRKLTMMQEEQKKRISKKSTPLPPARVAWHLGSSATLSDIQATATKREPSRPVMNTYAWDPAAANAGMMVLYGATQEQHGPPPLQTTMGFGVGAYGRAY